MSIATLVPEVPRSLVLGPLPSTATPVPLRRLPLPLLEPRPAVTALDDDPGVPADQQVLDLGLCSVAGRWNPYVPWARVERARADSASAGHAGASSAWAGAQGCGEDDAQPWVTRFVQAAVEASAGVRPTSQLVRWTSPEVQDVLERRALLAVRLARRRSSGGQAGSWRGRVLVRTVVCCSPRPGICEASAVVQDHDRTRAVAVRAERLEGRWRATVLELG